MPGRPTGCSAGLGLRDGTARPRSARRAPAAAGVTSAPDSDASACSASTSRSPTSPGARSGLARRSIRRSCRSDTGSMRPIGPVSSASACSTVEPVGGGGQHREQGQRRGLAGQRPAGRGLRQPGPRRRPARAAAARRPAAPIGRSTAICDHGTPSIRCARRNASAIIAASACAEAARRTATDPSSAPMPSMCLPALPPGSRTRDAADGARHGRRTAMRQRQRQRRRSRRPATRRPSPPRKPNTAWLGSPATRVRSAPAASTRARRAACGSSCWASSISKTRTRASSAASSRDRPRKPPARRRQVRRHPAPASWPAGPPSRPPPAAASPARTAGRIGRRRSIPGAGTRRPSRSSSCGSTPRSAQRANRFRSSVANPAVRSAGRRSVGHAVAARGPSSRSPASSSRMMASCSALVTSRGAHRRHARRPAAGPRTRSCARCAPAARERRTRGPPIASSAVVNLLRARVPMRPEPVSSRTDSGSTPAPI